jgi:hypothetical protein
MTENLTPSELQELDYFDFLLRSGAILSKEQLQRRIFLKKQQYKNCCLNPNCYGFRGIDSDKFCPKCLKPLSK